jgi:hypothetical protein
MGGAMSDLHHVIQELEARGYWFLAECFRNILKEIYAQEINKK